MTTTYECVCGARYNNPKAIARCEDNEHGLGRDHWLVSGRIDGIREALDTMRSGISRTETERRLEERIAALMKTG